MALSKQHWRDSWVAEKGDNVAQAKESFEKAFEMSKRAFKLAPNNRDYLNWCKMLSLKIEGDEIFSEGIALQIKADELKQQQKFDAALGVYRQALERYQKGFDLSNDKRFKECVDIVKENKKEIVETMFVADGGKLKEDFD